MPEPGEVADLVKGDRLEIVAARLAASGLHITDLALRRPTLDDVFLTLTGHHSTEPLPGVPVVGGSR